MEHQQRLSPSEIKLDYYGNTSLSWAAFYGDERSVRYCVEDVGFRVDWQNFNGETPLAMAIKGGDYDVVCILLEYGANPNVGNCSGEMPLHYAACFGFRDICCELVRFGIWLGLWFLGMVRGLRLRIFVEIHRCIGLLGRRRLMLLISY